MNKYHFTLNISFASDYDVENLANILKIKPTKVTKYGESVGKKSAKFIYKTQTFDDVYTDEVFAKFVNSIKANLEPLPQILSQNNGTCTIRIYFEQFDEKPCLSLANEVLGILYNLKCDYDVDFAI